MLVKANKNRRNRNAKDPAKLPLGPVINATCTIVAAKVQIDFDQAVSVSSLPVGITVQGVGPTAITVNNATRITLTYAAAPVATNVCVIPANVAQVRNRAGGYIVGKSTTF
jgi:hypothetical protein